jgi:hypothetical protein
MRKFNIQLTVFFILAIGLFSQCRVITGFNQKEISYAVAEEKNMVVKFSVRKNEVLKSEVSLQPNKVTLHEYLVLDSAAIYFFFFPPKEFGVVSQIKEGVDKDENLYFKKIITNDLVYGYYGAKKEDISRLDAILNSVTISFRAKF